MSGMTVVRSVLTAETLMKDYARAVGAMGQRLSANDEEGFRVHLAEANRLYPGIWDQLDHARTAAAALGRDTARYDELRAQRDAKGGVEYDADEWQVDWLRSIATVGVSARKRISVELNLKGVALAKSAAQTLRAAAPELDWAGEQGRLDALGNIDLTSRNTATAIKIIVTIIVIAVVAWIVSTLSK
jgi:hypothetical protein